MKERPIIFSTAMVQAILDNRKTMTRRPIKLPKDVDTYHWATNSNTQTSEIECVHWPMDDAETFTLKCPYGKPGDRLWVRETWAIDEHSNYIYRAWPMFNNGEPVAWNWKPSIYMPRSSARIILEITDVRVERLQDITEEDSVKEGIERDDKKRNIDIMCGEQRGYKLYPDGAICSVTAKSSFSSLWQSIYGPESWQNNPWVWVVSFKRIEP